MTSPNGNIFRVTGHLCREFTGPGEFPTQRPVTRSFDAFFDLRLNKQLSKQSWGWWFGTLLCPLWRRRNELFIIEIEIRACINNYIYIHTKRLHIIIHPCQTFNGNLVNSLAPGRPGCRFKTAIFNLIFLLVSSHQLRIMLWDECQGTSPMMSQQWFKVMDWCRQATSHYPSQCWPSSMSYGVTKTQWVNPQFKWHAWVGTYPTNH